MKPAILIPGLAVAIIAGTAVLASPMGGMGRDGGPRFDFEVMDADGDGKLTRTEIEALRDELADRYGRLPDEVDRLLDVAAIRTLGKLLGLERAIVREDWARLSFREGVVPKMAALEGPLKQRQAGMEVLRVHPLSMKINREGFEPMIETILVTLSALSSARSAAA